MNNTITVTLDGRRYRLASDEDPAYMLDVADYVNQQLTQFRGGNVYRSGVDCATLTALNLADTLFKERSTADDLRLQLKQALDDLNKAERRIKELKRTPRPAAEAPRPRSAKSSGRTSGAQLTFDED